MIKATWLHIISLENLPVYISKLGVLISHILLFIIVSSSRKYLFIKMKHIHMSPYVQMRVSKWFPLFHIQRYNLDTQNLIIYKLLYLKNQLPALFTLPNKKKSRIKELIIILKFCITSSKINLKIYFLSALLEISKTLVSLTLAQIISMNTLMHLTTGV